MSWWYFGGVDRIAVKVGECEAKHKDAVDNLGENEMQDALIEKAEYLFSVGDKTATVEAYVEAKKKVRESGDFLRERRFLNS